MSDTVYVTADLHLGHAKLAEVRGYGTVEEHDQDIVSRWNAIVRKRDVVYVLGDVFKLDLVPQLNGVKKLALGNHDRRPVVEYAAWFSKVAAYFEFDGCLLSHIPVHESQFHRWELNVHGHTHAHALKDQRYVPVSVEHTGMRPVDLRRLIHECRGRIAANSANLSYVYRG